MCYPGLKKAAPSVEGAAIREDASLDLEVQAEVVEKLHLVANQWKNDDFWKTLARPVERTIASLEKGDLKYACETLDALMNHLPGGTVGPLKSLPPDGILSEQKTVVRACRDVLRKALTPDKPVAPPQEEAILFEQHEYNSEATLRIKVPPGTKSKDASVTFGEQSLKVIVAGHDAQPVIFGTLFEKISPDDSAWFLEGEKETRVLDDQRSTTEVFCETKTVGNADNIDPVGCRSSLSTSRSITNARSGQHSSRPSARPRQVPSNLETTSGPSTTANTPSATRKWASNGNRGAVP